MAKVKINRTGGTSPLTYSLKLAGNVVERFISIDSDNVITFTAIQDGVDHVYDIKVIDGNNCESIVSFVHKCCDSSWDQYDDGTYYFIEEANPTAVPSGYSIIAKNSSVYALGGTQIHDTMSLTSPQTGSTTAGIWRRVGTSAEDMGPMNRAAIWTNVGTTINYPLNTWIGFTKCLTLNPGEQYYIGIGADNHYRLKINGDLKLEQLSNTRHFQLWKIFPIVFPTADITLTMEARNVELIAGFGCTIYKNTKAELLAATALSDLDVVFSSSEMIGEKFHTGGSSVISGTPYQWGYGCGEGFIFNSCTNKCEKYTTCTQI